MKHEKIIDTVFIVSLIITTILALLWMYCLAGDRSIDDDNLIKEFVWIFVFIFAIPAYIAEFDIYYAVKYFWVRKEHKNKVLAVLNILAVIVSFSVAIIGCCVPVVAYSLEVSLAINIFAIVKGGIGAYIVLRIVYIIINYCTIRNRAVKIKSILAMFLLSVSVGITGCSFAEVQGGAQENVAAYEKYANEFNCVKDYVLGKFPGAADKWLGVSVIDEKGRCLYDSDTNALLERSEDIIEALDKICDYGFPGDNAIFESVRIKNDSVYFCVSNEQYALVYSPKKSPVWFNDSVETDNMQMDELGDGWYHITVG